MLRCSKYGADDILCKEIMCPIVRVFAYHDFKDAVEIARANLFVEGAGHSSCIYSTDDASIAYAAGRLPVGRILVNMPNGGAAGLSYENGLAPTASVGCGSWGNNSISENLTYRHLLNVTKVAYPIENAVVPTPEEIWN
jgi:succinate-semialdehyde dehydrogenase